MTYKLNPVIGKITSPVIVSVGDTELFFDNGKQAAEYSFDSVYDIDEISASDNVIHLRLTARKTSPPFNFLGESPIV